MAIFGGRIMSFNQLRNNKKFFTKKGFNETIQISDSYYLTGIGISGPMEKADYFNHSCCPNLGLKGQIVIEAIRGIPKGEELTLDYAMIETRDPNLNFKCFCGCRNCRGEVTRNDWKRPNLQKWYKGHFSLFIEDKIKKISKSRICEK